MAASPAAPRRLAMVVGTVKWFNTDRGYGFIAPEQGKDVFVHVSALEASGLPALTEGQRVEFEVEQDAKGPRAVNVRTAGRPATHRDRPLYRRWPIRAARTRWTSGGQANAAGWIAPPHPPEDHTVSLGRTIGNAVRSVVRLQADHRAGQGAGDTVHRLDAGDHQPAEQIEVARLDSSDDVVGAGHVLGPLDTVKVADRPGDPSRRANLGLDEHVGAKHYPVTLRRLTAPPYPDGPA
jgi:cold shock protein